MPQPLETLTVPLGQDHEQPYWIVDGAFLLRCALDGADRRMKRRSIPPPARSAGEPATAPVDPDLQSRPARVGDKIGMPVAIDVGDYELKNEVPCLKPERFTPAGETHGKFRRYCSDLDAVPCSIAVEIRTLRRGRCRTRQQRHDDAAEDDERRSANQGHGHVVAPRKLEDMPVRTAPI